MILVALMKLRNNYSFFAVFFIFHMSYQHKSNVILPKFHKLLSSSGLTPQIRSFDELSDKYRFFVYLQCRINKQFSERYIFQRGGGGGRRGVSLNRYRNFHFLAPMPMSHMLNSCIYLICPNLHIVILLFFTTRFA